MILSFIYTFTPSTVAPSKYTLSCWSSNTCLINSPPSIQPDQPVFPHRIIGVLFSTALKTEWAVCCSHTPLPQTMHRWYKQSKPLLHSPLHHEQSQEICPQQITTLFLRWIFLEWEDHIKTLGHPLKITDRANHFFQTVSNETLWYIFSEGNKGLFTYHSDSFLGRIDVNHRMIRSILSRTTDPAKRNTISSQILNPMGQD